MTSGCVNKQLLIITTERSNLIHKARDIPSSIITISDLYDYASKSKWIPPNKNSIFFFAFIHTGSILRSSQNIAELSNDIILLMCKNLNTIPASNFVSGRDLVSNIATLFGPSLFGNSLSSSYFESGLSSTRSDNLPTNRQFTFVPENSIDTQAVNSDNLNNSSTSIEISNLPGETTSSLTNLSNELFDIIQSAVDNTSNVSQENSENQNVVNNTAEYDEVDESKITESDANLENNIENTLENIAEDNHLVNERNIIETNVNQNTDIQDNGDDTAESGQEESAPVNTDIQSDNRESDNRESDSNLSIHDNEIASQLLNIFQNTNNQIDYEGIKQDYLEQYNYMHSIGFNNDNKILTALYVCQGDIESAINYYLS